VTQTSVELFWAQPSDDGGCPLSGYSILRDDGLGGSFTEVHVAAVNNLPSLDTYIVTDLTASPVGKRFRFRMVAYNIGGKSVTSSSLRVTIASTPSTPLLPPSPDTTTTSGAVIRIVYSAPSDGGSTITNYEI